MNKLLAYIIIVIFLLSCSKDEFSCIPQELQNSVVAFYPFNNGDIKDASGKENHLDSLLRATPTKDRFGNMSCAFNFEEDTNGFQSIETENSFFLNDLESFSISLWYQPIKHNDLNPRFEPLISRDEGFSCPDRTGDWSLALYDCRAPVFGHENSVWGTPKIPSSCDSNSIEIGPWNHVVAIKNNSDFIIYDNNIKTEEDTGPASCTQMPLIQDIGPLIIGKGFTGNLDDIIVFNKALSNSEVNLLFKLEHCSCN